MIRPRAFVEAPAGLAAVSLCLQGGRHCRPPVSRMGNKAGYSVPILALAGLRPGQRADAYVWAESDADVRGLLRAYPDAAMLRQVADIIRGWAGEEPRALWERLRAERRERGAVGDAGGVAGWAILAQWAFRHGEPESGFGPSIVAVRPRTKTDHGSRGRTAGDEARLVEQAARAGWPPVAVLPTIPTAADLSAMLGTPGDLEGVVYYADPPYAPLPAVVAPTWPAFGLPMNVVFRSERRSALFAHGLNDFGCDVEDMPMMLAEVLRTAAGQQFEVVESIVELVTVLVVDDLIWRKWASEVSLHDQAVLHDVASVVADHPIAVLKPPLSPPGAPERREALDLVGHFRDLSLFRKASARAAAQFGQAWTGAHEAWAALCRSVARHELGTADLARHLERHVLTLREVRQGIARKYLRPTISITGYGDDLPREAVVRAALDAAAMGARVMVSEAVPVAELVAHGWHATDIGHTRRGAKRTFARVASEWVTSSFPPVETVARVEQVSMFGPRP